MLLVAVSCDKKQLTTPGQSSPSPSPSVSPTPEPDPPPDEPALAEVGSFDQPLYVTAPVNDPRLFVVEKAGKIKVVVDGQIRPSPFLDLADKILSGGEQGLLSLAFSPDYGKSGLAYVYYINNDGDIRVVEYNVSSDPNRLDPATAREILAVPHPTFSNHDGGLLAFDPSGMLIVGTGDGGGGGDPSNRAQSLSDLLGKLLRIDPRHPSEGRGYGIPSNNPFRNREGARPEIWAFGLRNPWRFAFAPKTNELFLADVGQNRWEEINFVPPGQVPGANFGWRVYEGLEKFSNENLDQSQTIRPVVVYPLSAGNCAVIGGYVYRGEVNSLKGTYIYGDHCAGFVKGFKISGGAVVDHRDFPSLTTTDLSSFGEDSAGQLYITSLGGKVFRVVRK